jgi:hypothetical protein
VPHVDLSSYDYYRCHGVRCFYHPKVDAGSEYGSDDET